MEFRSEISLLGSNGSCTGNEPLGILLINYVAYGWVMFRMNGISRVSTWMCDAIVSVLHGVFSSVGIKRCVMNYAPYEGGSKSSPLGLFQFAIPEVVHI